MGRAPHADAAVEVYSYPIAGRVTAGSGGECRQSGGRGRGLSRLARGGKDPRSGLRAWFGKSAGDARPRGGQAG